MKIFYAIRTVSILFVSSVIFLTCNSTITPDNALESYINNKDISYEWELYETHELDGITLYNILLTSQKWQNYTWRHHLAILVPKEIEHDGALLYISSGSNSEEMPNWRKVDDGSIQFMEFIAKKTRL